MVYYDGVWVGNWTLRFLTNGARNYRPILHGPLFARVNSVVFPLLVPTDFIARLVVAVIGGLLPLAAWSFASESATPNSSPSGRPGAESLLEDYSRFMRKDLPLVACILVTLGPVVRTLDTRRPRYLYAAGATMGVAFATKESVLLWLLTFLGAGLLVVRLRLLQRGDWDESLATNLRTSFVGWGGWG